MKAIPISLRLLLLSLLFGVYGCGVVDNNASEPQPLQDVRSYYYSLDAAAYTYNYSTPYSAVNEIVMQMDGKTGAKYTTSYSAAPADVYTCGWYFNKGPEYYYYFATCAEHAYYLMTNDGSIPDASFEDLRAPLKQGATWSFADASGNTVTAKVVAYGIHMRYNGVDYSDAIQVTYTSINRTIMKVFARNVGLVYSTSNLPDGSFENKIELVKYLKK